MHYVNKKKINYAHFMQIIIEMCFSKDENNHIFSPLLLIHS